MQPVPVPADEFLTYVEQRAGHKLIKSEQQFVRKFFGNDPIRIDTARHFHSFVIECYDDFRAAPITHDFGASDRLPSPVDHADTTDEPDGFDHLCFGLPCADYARSHGGWTCTQCPCAHIPDPR